MQQLKIQNNVELDPFWVHEINCVCVNRVK